MQSRFSTTTLFLVIALVAVCIGWFVDQKRSNTGHIGSWHYQSRDLTIGIPEEWITFRDNGEVRKCVFGRGPIFLFGNYSLVGDRLFRIQFHEIQIRGKPRRSLQSSDGFDSTAATVGMVVNENGTMCIADVDRALHDFDSPPLSQAFTSVNSSRHLKISCAIVNRPVRNFTERCAAPRGHTFGSGVIDPAIASEKDRVLVLSAAQTSELLTKLREAGWQIRDGKIHAPNGTMWLLMDNPWMGDSVDFFERMCSRRDRIKRNQKRGSDSVPSLADVDSLISVVKTMRHC
ncbi:MAG TPA: hypothetical protein DDW52_04520 [Planctomycetaceae bacterium]|nr:hypothetical protein [Planctomycetaceae bacterium]